MVRVYCPICGHLSRKLPDDFDYEYVCNVCLNVTFFPKEITGRPYERNFYNRVILEGRKLGYFTFEDVLGALWVKIGDPIVKARGMIFGADWLLYCPKKSSLVVEKEDYAIFLWVELHTAMDLILTSPQFYRFVLTEDFSYSKNIFCWVQKRQDGIVIRSVILGNDFFSFLYDNYINLIEQKVRKVMVGKKKLDVFLYRIRIGSIPNFWDIVDKFAIRKLYGHDLKEGEINSFFLEGLKDICRESL